MFLQKQPHWLIVGLGLFLIALIGGVDYITGPGMVLSILFVIVIILLTWFIGQGAGIIASILSASTGLLIDLTTREYASPAIPVWNAGARLGVFLIVTLTLASLITARSRQEEMVYLLVHDFRSPLNNILVGLTLLTESDADNLNEEQKHLVRISLMSGNQLVTIVNSILDVAKFESGTMTPVVRLSSVADLIGSSVEQVSALALEKHIRVTSHIAKGADNVLADVELTQRILINLIANALKYSPVGGVISLEAKPFGDRMIALSVADRGHGIPPEWQEHVFEKFVQVRSNHFKSRSGTGLGLRFCRLAVEAQQGKIWLESTSGKGTMVMFTLPQVEQE
jgi:signal transduction histidine kinase